MPVTIVMPAYNESEIIEDSVRRWHAEVIAKLPGARLVVVDDASSDDTGPILDRLIGELPGLGVIHSQKNQGHGPSVRIGLDSAETDYVFQTDSDLQHVPSEFWNLWNEREAWDFVVGVRSSRSDGLFRIVITRCMRLANFLVWGRWIRDANCPFKLMKREPMRRALAPIPSDSFIPMVLLSILIRKMDFRVKEMEVTHLPRPGGTPSLQGLTRWAGIAAHCMGEIVRLRFGWKSARRPEAS